MTLTFPRDLTTSVAWTKADLYLKWRQEISKQANGVTLAKDLGSPLWMAKYTSIEYPLYTTQAFMADFESLGGSVRPFWLHTAKRPMPASVNPFSPPTLTGVTVLALGVDTVSIRFTGLPAFFVISKGDYIGIDIPGGGKELLLAATGSTANGAGNSPFLDVTHPIRSTVAVGQTVTLINPVIEALLIPNTLQISEDGPLASFSFEATQVVR